MTTILDLTEHDDFTRMMARWVAAQLRRALNADGVEGVERKLGSWGNPFSQAEVDELLDMAAEPLEWDEEVDADPGYDCEVQGYKDSEFHTAPYRMAGATFAAFWRINYGCTDGRLELPGEGGE